MITIEQKSEGIAPRNNDLVALAPLLKWPGGKRRLVRHILPYLPANAKRYFEPFAGGGALFLATSYQRARISDINPELINFYEQVRDRPQALIRRMRLLKNDADSYYVERGRRSGASGVAAAARFMYLVSLAFNGIYRQNLRGKFNVPYGGRTRVAWFDEQLICAVSNKLQSVELLACDFELAVLPAKHGDIIYLDPPYTVAHSNNGFVKYNAKIFSWHDQIRLAGVANRLAEAGCHVIVSNADHNSIRELYPNFSEYKIERNSVIAASSEHRKSITESLFVGHNLFT